MVGGRIVDPRWDVASALELSLAVGTSELGFSAEPTGLFDMHDLVDQLARSIGSSSSRQ